MQHGHVLLLFLFFIVYSLVVFGLAQFSIYDKRKYTAVLFVGNALINSCYQDFVGGWDKMAE